MSLPAFRDILTDTSAALRQDGNVLSALAGLFIFVPLAVMFWLLLNAQMIRDAKPDMTEAEMEALTLAFVEAYGIWLLLLSVVVGWGQLAIAAFCLDPDRPTVGGAMAKALRLLFPYLAVMILLQLAIQLLAAPLSMLGAVGGIVMIAVSLVIGLRLFLLIPALAARGGGALSSVRESWRLTGGGFWKLFFPFIFGLIGAVFLGIIAIALLTLPVSALFGAEASGAATALLVALMMTVIALYALLFSFSAWRVLKD